MECLSLCLSWNFVTEHVSRYDESSNVESIGFCCTFPLNQYEVADEIQHDKLQKMSLLGLTKISIHLLFTVGDRMCYNEHPVAFTVSVWRKGVSRREHKGYSQDSRQ